MLLATNRAIYHSDIYVPLKILMMHVLKLHIRYAGVFGYTYI